METFLPPTLDGLILEADDKAGELLDVLRRLEGYTIEELAFMTTEAEHTVDQLTRHICQAIGLVEGVQHLLEHVKSLRGRCVDCDCR